MSQIDEATGLPELPEGMWWEVRKISYEASLNFIYSPDPLPHYEVVIRDTFGVRILAQPGKHWWSLPTPETVTTQDRDVDHAYIHGALTPKNIRRSAFGLVQSRNRKAKIGALLGTYPPKKLGASK